MKYKRGGLEARWYGEEGSSWEKVAFFHVLEFCHCLPVFGRLVLCSS